MPKTVEKGVFNANKPIVLALIVKHSHECSAVENNDGKGIVDSTKIQA